MTTAETRARHVVDTYLHEVPGAEDTINRTRLEFLISDAILKTVTEDREALRERMPCDTAEPCGFSMCAHHKALIAAVLDMQEGRAPAPRSLFSKPLS
jgi:hypothetical protein